jgi:hypothetical protein
MSTYDPSTDMSNDYDGQSDDTADERPRGEFGDQDRDDQQAGGYRAADDGGGRDMEGGGDRSDMGDRESDSDSGDGGYSEDSGSRDGSGYDSDSDARL